MSGIEATSPVQRVPTSGAKAGSKDKTSRDRRQELLIKTQKPQYVDNSSNPGRKEGGCLSSWV